MSRHHDPDRAGLPIDEWPVPDRLAWEQVRAHCRGPFRKYGGGHHLSEHTVKKAEKGLRRWLGFLKRTEELDDSVTPRDRITLKRLDHYFEHLRACGNADRSVVGRFEELQSALTIMYAGQDFRWITRPNGTPISQYLEMRVRAVFVPSNTDLLIWADDLFNQAVPLHDKRARCSQVRDAVMIAILATLAPRQRALASLRVGVHVKQVDSGWILDQTSLLTKEKNRLVLPLPAHVCVMLERYLSVERQELLGGYDGDPLWVSGYGAQLSTSGIVNMLWRRSRLRFGVAFSTHRFRTSLTTTSAVESPDMPFDSSLILGHGIQASLQNYNRATGIAASRRHAERLKKLRLATEGLARRTSRNTDRFTL